MANKITVKFEAQGAKSLKSAIDQLAVAQTRLNQGTKKAELLQKKLNKELEKYGKSGATSVRNTRLLDGAFATLRSRLLLVSFGFSLIAGSAGKALRMFGEQEKVILKLNNALGFNSKLLQNQASALQNITGVGDEVIIGSQAILASFVRNEKAVSQLTVASLDLSAALGIDLNSAANLIGKTIGSATNSLSRYGISVTGSANSTERIESLLKNVNVLFGDTAKAAGSSASGALDKLGASLGDFVEKLGELLVSVGFVTAIDILTASFKGLGLAVDQSLSFLGLSNEKVKQSINLSKEVVEAHNEEIQNIKSITDLNEARARVSELLAEKDKQVEQGVRQASEALHDNQKATNDLSGDIKSLIQPMSLQSDRFTKTGVSAKDQTIILEKNIESKKSLALTDKELAIAEAKVQELIKSGIALNFEKLTSENALSVARGELNEFEAAFLDIEAEKILIQEKITAGIINETEATIALNKVKLKEIQTEESLSKTRLDAAKKITTIGKNATEMLAKDSAAAKALMIADMMVQAIKIFVNTKELLSKAGVPPGVSTALAGVEFITVMSKVNEAKKFETGGIVGGRRHSQGGTMIEAEQGEFVMSRDAVESIGAGTLEAMNQGGGGAITVNVSGNVMTDDFVENELAEKVSTAIRRGISFGMS